MYNSIDLIFVISICIISVWFDCLLLLHQLMITWNAGRYFNAHSLSSNESHKHKTQILEIINTYYVSILVMYV